DGAGLDHGWFVHDASQAQKDVAEHAIYATSFRRTDTFFPLVWSRDDKSVSAVNVTERYAAKSLNAAESKVRLSVKVNRADGRRVVSNVLVSDPADSATRLEAKSRGETADLNDLATFKVVPGQKYHVVARLEADVAESDVTVTE